MLRPIVSTLALLALLGAFAPSVLAEPQQEKAKAKAKTLDFEGDTIRTDQINPELVVIEPGPKAKRQPFTTFRTEFSEEAVRSAEDL